MPFNSIEERVMTIITMFRGIVKIEIARDGGTIGECAIDCTGTEYPSDHLGVQFERINQFKGLMNEKSQLPH